MDTQLAAIPALPIRIQVHDHGVLPAHVVAELIEVFFIKAAGLVQGVVKLVSGDAGIAGTVQVEDELVHQVEECRLVDVVMFPVQPEDLIASHRQILQDFRAVACTCRVELLVSVKADEVSRQMAGEGAT